jgi:hypothetical protein
MTTFDVIVFRGGPLSDDICQGHGTKHYPQVTIAPYLAIKASSLVGNNSPYTDTKGTFHTESTFLVLGVFFTV